MSFNTRHRSRKPLLLLLVPLILFIGVVIAATLLTTNVSVTVSPPTGAFSSVTIGSQPCTPTGTSATCPSVTLGFGTSEILTVKIQGSPTAPVLVNANSNPSGVVSITPGSNPSALDGAGQATFTFTITGVAAGSTSVTVTLSI